MQRSKRILLVSHCILNQNTVIENEARAEGPVLSAATWALREGFGILQLPCPEFTFLGLNRPPMTYEEYDTPDYRKHCREILKPVLAQVKDYLRNGYELAGLLGIQSSPSCDPGRGVFMEELMLLFSQNGIELENLWYLPNSEEPLFRADEHLLPQ